MAMFSRCLLEPRSLVGLFGRTSLLWSPVLKRGHLSSAGSTVQSPQTTQLDEHPEEAAAPAAAVTSDCSQDPTTHKSGALVLRKRPWTKVSRRSGVIALKLGMTQLWKKNGMPMAVTVLQIVDNQVVMVRTKEKEGYFALQVGAIDHPKPHNVLRPVLGQFVKAGVPPKRKLAEFRVTANALLPIGTNLDASHYVPGQFVDVCAKSIGKGFQGVMKRHHMKGQPASHGATKTHRKMGATGGGQEPGRIFPGKRMPGRMGGKRVTSKCRMVCRVNHKYNIVYVKGPVPGHKNTYVRVTDAMMKTNFTAAPFPTFIADEDGTLPEEVYAQNIHPPHESTLLFSDKRKPAKKG